MTTSALTWVRFGSSNPRFWQSAAAFLCIGFLLGSVIYFSYRHDTDMQRIDVLESAITTTQALPLEDAQWQQVELPWRLCPVTEAPCYEHLRVSVPRTRDAQALYLPGYKGAVRVSVNGVALAQIGSLTPPIESVVFRPAFVAIPPPLLAEEVNELIVTIGADRRNFLRVVPFYVGSAAELEPVWRIASWLSIDLLVASTGIYIVLGFLALLTYRLARENVLFPWFAAIVFCAAARNSYFLWTDPAFDLLRNTIYFQATLGQLAAIVGFTGALVGVGRNRNYLLIAGLSVLVCAVLLGLILLDNYEGSYAATLATQVLMLATGVWALIMLGRYQRRGWHVINPWVFALFVAAFALALHDASPSFLGVPVAHQLSNLAPLCLVIAFCFILAQQFSQALASVRAHNVELKAAVARREQALHSAYANIRKAEREQAVETERVRILQDVHDGVGGRLAGLVLMARRRGDAEMAAHIQESLVDLRLIIDSLDDELTNDLAEALNLFRSRAEKLLAAHHIDLDWQVIVGPRIAITPAWMVSILRVLQECLHNVVKHADATEIRVLGELNSGVMHLRVLDNGIGIADMQKALGVGRGLSNVSKRVAGLGGEVRITSQPQHTSIEISVPLPASPTNMGVSAQADFD